MKNRDRLTPDVVYWWQAMVENDATGAWAEMDGTTTGVEGVTVADVRRGLQIELRRKSPGAVVTRFEMGER